MYRLKVIFDNDVLVNLTALSGLDIFPLFRNIFEQILIPMEVATEYERYKHVQPRRKFILDRLQPNYGFWSLCTSYDSFTVESYKTYEGIDKGEAEILSQADKLGVSWVFSDDTKFKETTMKLNKNLRINNSVFLVANLDMHGYLKDSFLIFAELYRVRPFKHRDLIDAYDNVSGFLNGIKINPQKKSKRTYKQIVDYFDNE